MLFYDLIYLLVWWSEKYICKILLRSWCSFKNCLVLCTYLKLSFWRYWSRCTGHCWIFNFSTLCLCNCAMNLKSTIFAIFTALAILIFVVLFWFRSVQDLFIAGGSKNSSENFSIPIEYNINTIHKHARFF